MNKLKFITIFTAIILCLILYIKCDHDEVIYDIDIQKNITINDPPCLQMYFYIQKYAKIYNIPEEYAFGLAYQETRYEGPFDWSYNHKQKSYANAYGPMQIQIPTARGLNKDNISEKILTENIDYNVMTSMKLLRRLKDKYGDWRLVFGAYNSGKPIINDYAIKIYNKQYTWVK